MTKTLTALALLAALAACASGETGRYSAATGKLEASQERLDRASAEFVDTQQRCAAEVSDDCVSQADKLAAELEDAKAAREAAAADIAAAKVAQARAFGRGLAVMQEVGSTPTP